MSFAVGTKCDSDGAEFVFSGPWDQIICYRPMPSGRYVQDLTSYSLASRSFRVTSLAVLEDGNRTAAASGCSVYIWDRREEGSRMLQAQLDHLGPVKHIVRSENDR